MLSYGDRAHRRTFGVVFNSWANLVARENQLASPIVSMGLQSLKPSSQIYTKIQTYIYITNS